MKGTRTETARAIKEGLDRLFGPTWHVFVGSTYGCQVKYAKGFYIFFQIDKVFLCIFKSPPLSQRKGPTVRVPEASPPPPADFKVLVSKMDPVMEAWALSVSEEAASLKESYKEMAIHVKDWFDEHYGSGWIVLFGLLNTGSFASRDQVDYISFNLRSKIRVLIYRHHDGSAEEVVLGDSPERYYIQILPSAGHALRVVAFLLWPLQFIFCICLVALHPTYFLIPAILLPYGLLAIRRGWPSTLSFYLIIIALNIALTSVAMTRSCHSHYCRAHSNNHTPGQAPVGLLVVYALLLASHSAALVTVASLAMLVRSSIARVGNQSLQPLFQP